MEIYLYIYFIYFQIWNIKLVCNFQELFCENFYILSPISIRRSFCLLKGFEGHAISIVKIWGWLMWKLGVRGPNCILQEELEHPWVLLCVEGWGAGRNPHRCQEVTVPVWLFPQVHSTQPSSMPRSHWSLPTSVNPRDSNRKTMRSFRTLVKWVVPKSVSSSFVCLESFALSLLVLPPPCPNPCQRIPELWKHPSLHIALQRTGRLLSHILGTYKCLWSTSVFHWAHKKINIHEPV